MGLANNVKLVFFVFLLFLFSTHLASFKIFKSFDEFADMTRKVAENSDFLDMTRKIDIDNSYLKFVDSDLVKLRKTVKDIFPNIEKITKVPIAKMNKFELDDILIKSKKISEIQNRYPASESQKILKTLGEDQIYLAIRYGDSFTDQIVSLAMHGNNYAIKYADTARKSGAGIVKFYESYIKGKEKLWISSGLLTAFLIAPKQFATVMGDITEHGLKQISDAGIYLTDEFSKSITAAATHTAKNFAEKIMTNPLSFIIFCSFVFIFLMRIKQTRIFFSFVFKKNNVFFFFY